LTDVGVLFGEQCPPYDFRLGALRKTCRICRRVQGAFVSFGLDPAGGWFILSLAGRVRFAERGSLMDRDTDRAAVAADQPALSPAIQFVLSAVVVVHFAAIGVNILAEPSGPWPSLGGGGIGLADSPAFITEGMASAARSYVMAVRLGETGRFPSNRLQPLQVQLEAILYNDAGEEVGKQFLPDPNSFPWNRAREQLIAQALANDVLRPNPGNESIPPPGQEPEKVQVWRPLKQGDTIQHLTQVPIHLLTRPPDPPDWGPSDWGLTLSRSYAVHLCRATGANAVELRRRWRYQPAPFMIEADPRPLGRMELEQLGERVSTYGKVSDAEPR
jgi:hypothetical protein